MIDWQTLVELVSALAWPVVIAVALFAFRKPLSTFIGSLSGRVTKFSVFDIAIELAELPTPPVPWDDPRIHQGSEMIGGEANNSTIMTLFQQIGEEKPWDYMIVDIKDGKFWLISRIFIFTVFLQAMRSLKCVVFVQTSGELRRFVGLASAVEIRSALGQSFPWLEWALANALKVHATDELGPTLRPDTATQIILTFIEDHDMRLLCDPKEMLKPVNTCQVPENERPAKPINPEDWTGLTDQKGKTFWEHSNWLDLKNTRVSEVITKNFFEWDSSHYMETLDISNDERIQQLLRRKTPYIALVNSRGEFKALLDRQKLVTLVGEALVNR